eukprot:COSAG02_NODE_549_length_20461_cov_11.385866_14_plen_45_part_00
MYISTTFMRSGVIRQTVAGGIPRPDHLLTNRLAQDSIHRRGQTK